MDRTNLIGRDPRVLRSLHYFEAVARLGSVAAAAEETGVSASAISHQLRALTSLIGEDLVTKSGRGIVLTDAGFRLQHELSSLFQSLGTMLDKMLGEHKTCLRVAVCSSFGPSWLAERLPDFQRRHPEIDLELRLYAQDPLQTDVVADVVITAAPIHAGFDHLDLFEEHLVPVASPSMARGPSGLPLRLITTDVPPHAVGADWYDYASQTGRDYTGAAEPAFLRCTHYVLALSLAKAGMGAALIPDFLAEEAVAEGRVVLLDRQSMPSRRVYRVCYKSMRAGDPAVRSFVRWLRTRRSPVNDAQAFHIAS